MSPETEIVDLEGGGAVDNQNTEDLPDDDALFAPYTYSRSLAKPTLSKSAKGFTPFPPSIDQSVLDEITKTFKPRDSDIWIVSYPKR